MINGIQAILSRILLEHPPKNMLCLGRETGDAVKEFLAQWPQCRMTQLDITALGVHKTLEMLNLQDIFEFGIVADSIEHLNKTSAEHLLARLRDIHTKKLLIIVPISKQWKNHTSYWEETDLLALGFILKAKLTVKDKPVHVYAFDITSYKTTPEWLNSKYWANPDLWNRYWW